MDAQKTATQPASRAHTAPALILVDVSAPLQECLRRLQAQTIRVAAAAALQPDTHTTPTAAAAAAAAGASTVEPSAAPCDLDDRKAEQLTRHRIARKLRRLRATRHLDLCASTACASDGTATTAPPAVPSTSAAPPANGAGSASTGRSGSSRTPGRAPRPPPLTGLLWDSPSAAPAGGADDTGDDVFGWVTQPTRESPERLSTLAGRHRDAASPVAVPPPPPPAPARSPPPGAPMRADGGAVEPLLRRAAVDVADAVACEQRWAAPVEDVLQQLRSLESSVMGLVAEEGEEREGGAAADAVGPRLRRLLAFAPTHTIATAEELGVWRRAWDRAAVEAGTGRCTAPALDVGTSVELLDVAVLARDNARRYTALRQRWAAVRHAYETRVTRLNRQLAMAALQLDEMEAMQRKP